MTRQAACAAALSGLPGMGPAHLARLLDGHDPEEVWSDVLAGRVERPAGRRSSGAPGQTALDGVPGPVAAAPSRSWAAVAARLDPERWWAGVAAKGIGVTWIGRPDYPAALVGDPQPPGVLFWKGRIESLDRLCVAIVGTRNATPDGRSVAYDMGRDLTRAGVCVVSGLALGIDGAAHSGALDAVRAGATAAPVGVAASGVDVPYPRRHTDLWAKVAAAGAMVSETLPGRPAQAWRFPARNRIIAGLARLVVVVESHQCGGSLITAEAAIERGIDVRAVPGPVHSPASAGSNQLLYDGPGPVRHAQDVLDALGIFESPGSGGSAGPGRPGGSGGSAGPGGSGASWSGQGSSAGRDRTAGLDRTTTAVLDALGWRSVNPGQLMARTGLGAPEIMRALDALEAEGLVRADTGWWSRRS